MSIRWITGDVFDGLAQLKDESVDLVVTSPPFLALRSYLPADHPDKAKEIGSEATPAEFIDTLLAVTAELRRVLAPHGSIAIELGDTYSGAGGYGSPDSPNPAYGNGERFEERWEGRTTKRFKKKDDGWPESKSRALIPQLYEIALAYGINPLTGAESPAGRWRIRNVVTWARPNPPVGALGDKWRPATSDVVVAATSPKRYWDDLATRRTPSRPRLGTTRHKVRDDEDPMALRGHKTGEFELNNPAGAPLLDYWEIPPGGYKGAHYAVFPPALVEPLVKAMCPEKVCRTCGEPSRRIVETTGLVGQNGYRAEPVNRDRAFDVGAGPGSSHGKTDGGVTSQYQTLGFTDCGHDDYRAGLVLDPFAGSGTTLAVATGHGHDAIGIDLDPRNEDLARERIGPLLFEMSDELR